MLLFKHRGSDCGLQLIAEGKLSSARAQLCLQPVSGQPWRAEGCLQEPWSSAAGGGGGGDTEPSCPDTTLREGPQQGDISLQFSVVCSETLAGSIPVHRLNMGVIDNVWALAGVLPACTQAACSVKTVGIQNAGVQSTGEFRTSLTGVAAAAAFSLPLFVRGVTVPLPGRGPQGRAAWAFPC